MYPKLLAEVNAKASEKDLTYLDNELDHYTCHNCDNHFRTKKALELHIKKTHKKSSNLLTINTSKSPDASKKQPKFTIHAPMNVLPYTPTTLNCDLCGSVFYKEEFLKEHEATVHLNTQISDKSSQQTSDNLNCPLCGKTFTDPTAVTNHIQAQHQRYCTHCDAVFFDQYDLNNHIYTTHVSQSFLRNSTETFETDHQVFSEQLLNLECLAYTCILEDFASGMKETEFVNQDCCEVCEVTSDNPQALSVHNETTHMNECPQALHHQIYNCDFCSFSHTHKQKVKEHVASKHDFLSCDQCIFITPSQFNLDLHVVQCHDPTQADSQTLYSCDLCGITFTLENDLNKHIQRRHTQDPPQSVSPSNSAQNHSLAQILEEQIDMAQTLKQFKESVSAQLSVIHKDQEALKDTIKHLANETAHINISNHAILDSLQTRLQEQISSLISSFSPQSVSGAPSTSSVATQTSSISSACLPPAPTVTATPVVPPPSLEAPVTIPITVPLSRPSIMESNNSYPLPPPFPPPSPQSKSVSNPPALNKRQHPTAGRIPTSKRHKVLFIADYTGSNVDIRHLEEATNTLIYSEKAFGTSFKANSLYPYDNFIDVSMTAPTKRNYSYAVLQSSSTDISELDTSQPTNIHYLKQEVFIASQNMITAARNIIVNNRNIKKVLILDAIPRFDPDSSDPHKLKPELSKYANEVLRNELEKCDVKDQITIGMHSLPSSQQQNLYGHPSSPYYDGVHLHGPDGRNHYTRSVCNVLQSFMSDHSRDLHNHIVPRVSLHYSAMSSSSSITTSTPCSNPPLMAQSVGPNILPGKNKSSHIIIEIESENRNEQQYTYSIPTYNPFSLLEN